MYFFFFKNKWDTLYQYVVKNDGCEKACDAKISSFSGSGKNAPTRESNLIKTQYESL